MQKKYFTNPVLTVVRMQNDIIATSNIPSGEDGDQPDSNEAPMRRIWE